MHPVSSSLKCTLVPHLSLTLMRRSLPGCRTRWSLALQRADGPVRIEAIGRRTYLQLRGDGGDGGDREGRDTGWCLEAGCSQVGPVPTCLLWALCFLGLVLALTPPLRARSFIRAPWANIVLTLPCEPAPCTPHSSWCPWGHLVVSPGTSPARASRGLDWYLIPAGPLSPRLQAPPGGMGQPSPASQFLPHT